MKPASTYPRQDKRGRLRCQRMPICGGTPKYEVTFIDSEGTALVCERCASATREHPGESKFIAEIRSL